MSEINNDELDIETLDGEETPTNDIDSYEEVEEVEEETPDERDERITKLEEAYKNQKMRAEKAEKALKQAPAKKTDETLTTKDQFVLLKEGIEVDDIDRVIKFAKDENVSVAEALQNKELKAIIGIRTEERRIANATNTNSSKRGSNKASGEALLSRFNETGALPESDDDMDRFVESRLKSKLRT